MVAIFLVVLLGVSALAIDVGYAYAQQRYAQNVADSAATAGALTLLARGGAATDTQVKQAMDTVLRANGVVVSWDIPGVATPDPANPHQVRAEYAYRDPASETVYPSGSYVGRGAGSGAAIPTQVVSGTTVSPNTIVVDRLSTRASAFFGRVLGYRDYAIQVGGSESVRQAAGFNLAAPTSTPLTPTVNATMCSIPLTAALNATSPITSSWGFYTSFTTQASGDITATWTLNAAGASSGNFEIGLYSGAPLGAGAGLSQWDPAGSWQAGNPLVAQPPKMEAIALRASNGTAQTQTLDYTADTGQLTATGPATYTAYFFNATNKNVPITALSLGYMCSASAPKPLMPAVPAAPFVPFALWAYPTGGLHEGGAYTFWGSQWDSQVAGAGYYSTARFKGYIDTLPTTFNPANPASLSCPAGSTNPATCYSTHPGNNSAPPGAPGYTGASVLDAQGCLPAYINAPVIGSASRAGNLDYGSIVAIVTLRVDTPCAYKPDPGHPMSGIIVAAPWDPGNVVGPLPPGINQ